MGKNLKLYGFGTVLIIYPLLFYIANNTQRFELPEVLVTLGLLIASNLFVFGFMQMILTKLGMSNSMYVKICTGLLLLLWLIMMKPAIYENPELYYVASFIINFNVHKFIIYAVCGALVFALGFFLISQNLGFFLGLCGILNLWNITHALAFPTRPYSKSPTPEEQTVAIKNKKNIFFILTDSLTNEQGMDRIGIKEETKPFFDKFKKNGFTVYSDFYTSLQPTINALYTYIAMSYKQAGQIAYRTEMFHGNDILNDGKFYHILRKNGYSINIVHDANFFGSQFCSADLCYFRDQQSNRTLKTRVAGIIHFLLPRVITTKVDLFCDPTIKTESTREASFFSNKLADQVYLKTPNFTYIHAFSLPGHTGIDISTIDHCNEQAEIKKYLGRIKLTEEFVWSTIQTIQARDKNALIIVAGDHGPYILRQCTRKGIDKNDQIMERQGAFLAILWGDDYIGTYDSKIKSSHNLFRYILSYLAGNEELLLHKEKDNAYTYTNRFRKITLTMQDGVPRLPK
ncbi:MAG: hypothetical protein A3F18_02845 [Legionellales bacterium RIFCSPHIGHO2_12_FULL_37_14]|nr:MAG: hypothetical protein A3F18_02845 [Legionellales bacterium RIFCSPHIGHO2_12_FULL_37_14]